MATTAKVTVKGQTTIPREVRAALHIKAGDLLLWETSDEGVAKVRRVQPLDLAYLRAVEGTLGEWSSNEDEEAYGGL
jgi:AbrB family looped-hinge helix DNA binding protein